MGFGVRWGRLGDSYSGLNIGVTFFWVLHFALPFKIHGRNLGGPLWTPGVGPWGLRGLVFVVGGVGEWFRCRFNVF